MPHAAPARQGLPRTARLFATVLALLLAAGLLVSRPPAAWATEEPVLSGTVTAGGAPVAGAFVVMSGEAARATTLTDEAGEYEVRGLPDGDYSVVVQAAGYRVAEATATIADGATPASPSTPGTVLTTTGSSSPATATEG